MNSYRDLKIFQDAKRLALRVHEISLQLPKYELYEEGSQVRRSSKSVASMIVEGYGRKRYKKDYIKFLIYAHAECDETILHLSFLVESGSMTDQTMANGLVTDYEKLSKQINRFIKWVDENIE